MNHTNDSKQVEMTYAELAAKFRSAERNGIHMTGYIQFTRDSFTEEYSEQARTYGVSSNNKAYRPNMGGYSIYGGSLDGSDPCVRLEQYMADECGGKNGWKVERCYGMSDELERIEAQLKRGRGQGGDSFQAVPTVRPGGENEVHHTSKHRPLGTKGSLSGVIPLKPLSSERKKSSCTTSFCL